MTAEYRIRELELGYEELSERVALLERQAPEGAPETPPAPAAAPPPPSPQEFAPRAVPPVEAFAPRRAPRRRATTLSFEDLLGGRILALIGAAAIVLAGAFFFALAVSNGWIGEAARTLLAGTGSVALFALGVWLHERKGRTYASLSITGAGLACCFLTVTVAAEVYDLIPASAALALALLVGACGTILAVRWSAAPIGAVGIIGALLAPVLAGAPDSGTTLALLFVANAAAVSVLLWQRWDWLGLACFVVAGPQWVSWLFDSGSAAGSVLALFAFGALGVGAAIGFELRVPAARLRPSSAFLLTLNALTLATAGWFALVGDGDRTLAELWLCFLAVAHLGVGIGGTRLKQVSQDVGFLVLVLGVVLADVAFSLLVSGPALAIGYAATSVVFALLLRGKPEGPLAETLVSLGLGGQVVLALGHALAFDAPPTALAGESIDLAAAVWVLGSLAASLFISARVSSERYPQWRLALDSLGLVVLAYTAVLVLDGAMLVAVLAVGAVALAQLARQTGDELAAVASASFLGGALFHALVIEAPPQALVYGVESLPQALAALGVCGLAALACAHQRLGDKSWQLALWCGGAVSLLYLASVGIVTAFQPGGAETTVLDLPVRQQGQVLVSALWGLAGLVALLTGLRRDLRELRIGALALLLAAVAKVFLYDLSTLGSVYRVVSFLALGALLLAASFAYQRLRPTPLPDLREVARAQH
jgi:uncharacterized membrane protein